MGASRRFSRQLLRGATDALRVPCPLERGLRRLFFCSARFNGDHCTGSLHPRAPRVASRSAGSAALRVVTTKFPNQSNTLRKSASGSLLYSDQKKVCHRGFLRQFLRGHEALQYGGSELPEPLERLALPTICMASTEDLGIDFKTSVSR